MFKLTFRNQIILGILMMMACYICADIFQQASFVNAATVVYGLLFVIHPVYPESVTNPRMKLYMRLTGLFIVILGLLSRYNL